MRRLRRFSPWFSLLPLLGIAVQGAEAPGAPAATTAEVQPGGIEFHQVIAPDGVPLNVAVAGNPKGRALLMLHGAYQSYMSFIPQLRDATLAARYRLVAMDMRGHGGSGKPWKTEAYLGSKPWADDVQSVITALALNKPLLVGWSFGGYVAMDYVREYGAKSVSGVVLIGSHGGLLPRPAANGPLPTGDLEALQVGARQFMAAMSAAPLPQAAVDRGYAAYLMMPSYARIAMRGKRLDNTDLVGRLDLPLLVVLGGRDPSVPQILVRNLVSKIAGARLEVYAESGHSTFVEEAARFNAELDRFASSLSQVPAR